MGEFLAALGFIFIAVFITFIFYILAGGDSPPTVSTVENPLSREEIKQKLEEHKTKVWFNIGKFWLAFVFLGLLTAPLWN